MDFSFIVDLSGISIFSFIQIMILISNFLDLNPTSSILSGRGFFFIVLQE